MTGTITRCVAKANASGWRSTAIRPSITPSRTSRSSSSASSAFRFTAAAKPRRGTSRSRLRSCRNRLRPHDMRYAIVIERGETTYGAYVPDLPGCVAAAESREEVVKLIGEAINQHIQLLREEGLPIPEHETAVTDCSLRPPRMLTQSQRFNGRRLLFEGDRNWAGCCRARWANWSPVHSAFLSAWLPFWSGQGFGRGHRRCRLRVRG